MEAMTVKKFDRLSKRDFDNGATLNEIRTALKDRERLLELRKRRVRTALEKMGERSKQ